VPINSVEYSFGEHYSTLKIDLPWCESVSHILICCDVIPEYEETVDHWAQNTKKKTLFCLLITLKRGLL
jgi:hypothetical protein